MGAADLIFEPKEHRYLLGGREVPSVSTIIAPLVSFDGVPPDRLAAAAARGTAVHKACELADQDDLDIDSLDPSLAGYLAAWFKFKADTAAEIVFNERKLGSKTYQFAGTLDRVARLPKLGGLTWLLDIKSSESVHAWHGVQLAGYRLLLDEAGVKVDKAGVVQLRPDGRYLLHPFGHPDDARCFVSLLTIYHWRKKNV